MGEKETPVSVDIEFPNQSRVTISGALVSIDNEIPAEGPQRYTIVLDLKSITEAIPMSMEWWEKAKEMMWREATEEAYKQVIMEGNPELLGKPGVFEGLLEYVKDEDDEETP